MCSFTNNTGGLEIYCVGSFSGNRMAVSVESNIPRNPIHGIALSAAVSSHVLAHEIGHACGWEDIIDDAQGDALVSLDLLGWDNWSNGDGTGYYPPDLRHNDLIPRLLMYYKMGAKSHDIPLVGVKIHLDGTTSLYTRKIGAYEMNRNPRH